jgi:hypothetical protein
MRRPLMKPQITTQAARARLTDSTGSARALLLACALAAGCAPPAADSAADALDALQASDATQAVEISGGEDAAAPTPPDPVTSDFSLMCDLAVEARRAGKMGNDKLFWVADELEVKGQTEQVKRLLDTMLSVPVANRCLLLQSGARRAELSSKQLCTALCPMIRYEEAALKDVKLAVSSSDSWANPTPQWTLIASPQAVRLGQLAVAPVFDGAIDPALKDGDVIRAVRVMLDLTQTPSASPTASSPPESGVALLVVDARARVSLVRDLIATLTAEGATRFELMLQGGGKLGEAPPMVEAAQLSDDAVLALTSRADAPPTGTPRLQLWADDLGVLLTTFGPDGAPTQTLQPACQRTVCALDAEHPLARVHWINLYNALLTAQAALGPDAHTLEVAASDLLTVELFSKFADIARYHLTATPGAPPSPIPADQADALLRWQPARDAQGQPMRLFDEVVLTPAAEVVFPPPPVVTGIEFPGLPPDATAEVTTNAVYLRGCFTKHGKTLATDTRPYMVMLTLTLGGSDGLVSDVRLLEMTTASGVVAPDLDACLTDRLKRLRFPTVSSPLRFLIAFEP